MSQLAGKRTRKRSPRRRKAQHLYRLHQLATSSKSQLSDSEDENKLFHLKCLRLYSRKTKTSGIMLELMPAFWMNLKGIGVTPEETVFVPVDQFSTSVK